MRKFTYKLVSPENALMEGNIAALSPQNARKKLEENGSTVILIKKDGDSLLKRELNISFFSFPYIEKINFFRDMSVMMGSGISLIEILKILKEQVKAKGVKDAITDMGQEIENGRQLSQAMAKYPKYFPAYVVESVRTGEVSGRLTQTLHRIAEDYQKNYELRRKVIGAITYPALVIMVMVVVVLVLIMYVLPQIALLFEEFDAMLPLPTRILLGTGDFFGTYPLFIPGMATLLITSAFFAMRIEKSRYVVHSMILKTPILGKLIREYNLLIFFRALESLIASGVSFVYAVEIAEKTFTNDVYKKAISTTRPALLHGIRFAEILEPHEKLFPRRTQKIIEIGETSGSLENAFARITKYYEESVDHQTKMLTVMIEPILMLLIGLVVGGMALSIFLPIYKAASLF